MGYGTVLHGEAVAAGMVAACRVSQAMGHMPACDVQRVVELLKKCSLPCELRALRADFTAFWQAMGHDKKAVRGQLKFVIPEALGRCVFPVVLEQGMVRAALLESR